MHSVYTNGYIKLGFYAYTVTSNESTGFWMSLLRGGIRYHNDLIGLFLALPPVEGNSVVLPSLCQKNGKSKQYLSPASIEGNRIYYIRPSQTVLNLAVNVNHLS